MTTGNPTRAFLAHLHRGGRYAYWWTSEGRQSFWWEAGKPGPLPGGRRNLYFGVNPTNEIPAANRRGKETDPKLLRSHIDDVAAINCLFGDFDAKLFGDKDAALAAALRHDPSVVIDTGGGYHAYWLLDEPWILDSAELRAAAIRAQAAWVGFIGADEGVKDIARVLRVPGSRNWKYDPAPEVTYVRCDLDRTFDRDDLLQRVPPAAPADEARTVNGPTPSAAAPAWASRVLASAIAKVLDSTPGARHNPLLEAARLAGGAMPHLSESEIIRALSAAYTGSEPAEEVERVIRDGIAYGQAVPLTPPEDVPALVWRGELPYCPECSRPARRSKFHDGYFCDAHEPAYNWRGSDAARPAAPASPDGPPDAAAPPRTSWPWPVYRGPTIDQIPFGRSLVYGLMQLRAVAMWAGPSESGKTTIMADLICKLSEFYTVIYVAGEDSGGVKAKIRAWELLHNKQRSPNLIIIDAAMPLLNPQTVSDLIAFGSTCDPKLIVFDTLSQCIPGVDENSPEVSLATAHMNQIAQALDCHVAFMHHTLKSSPDTFRGHSSLENNTHTRVVIRRDKGDDQITLSVERHKGARMAPASFRLVIRDTDYRDADGRIVTASVTLPTRRVMRPASHISERELAILHFLADVQNDGGATTTEIQKELAARYAVTEGRIRRDLSRLKDIGLVEGEGRQARTLTTLGLQKAAQEVPNEPTEAVPDEPFEINLKLDRDLIPNDPDPRPRSDRSDRSDPPSKEGGSDRSERSGAIADPPRVE